MAREGFFDHIDSHGDSVVEHAKHARVRGWQKIGENLFECEPTNELASLAIRGWMHSPTHRENILDPEWRATGSASPSPQTATSTSPKSLPITNPT